MSTIDVVVGRIGKPHGLRGEVTIHAHTDEPEKRFAVGERLRAEVPNGSAVTLDTLSVTSSRVHQGTWLIGFAEIPDRNAADAARGILLHADLPVDATPEDPDEFYVHQLIGLTAYDQDGAELGQVTALTAGAQDLLTIRTPDGRDALVPFVKQLVPEVDIAAGHIVVADRPGLVAPAPDED